MDPVGLLADLMRIESHDGVAEIGTFLLDTVEGATRHETGCVIAEKSGGCDGPRIVLNSHMDVVSPHVPYRRDGDVIRGRGACDAKGCLAPMITAFDAVEPAAGSVQLVVSPDEETTQRGLTEYLAAAGVDADAVVVGEPSGLDVCPSARGHYDLEITFSGESAHGATPESGLNATACMAEAVKRLAAIPHLHDDELGSNSYTPTIAQAGNLPNQVPEAATLVVDYRTLPVESRKDAIETVSDALVGIDCEYEVAFYEAGSSLGSYRTDREEAVVADLADCVESVTGERPALEPFPAATEAAFFAEDAPTVVFGPGLIADGGKAIAHSEREYVPVREVEDAAESLALLLEHWLSRT